jgi:aminomethyltransferase
MSQKTPLYEQHLVANGKMVDFAGWQMPINYGSQLKEHNQVREDSGMFDVSHMVVLDVVGSQSKQWLQKLLANDVAKISDYGKALYSCMCDLDGGIIDDLIVYHFTDEKYRIVVNAGTRAKDIAWMQSQTDGFDVKLTERADLAMIAIQGPTILEKSAQVFTEEQLAKISPLKRFYGEFIGDWMVARTGYTGEDGYEVMLPEADAVAFWKKCVEAGIKPTGLGARDTLRLEAGMNLYGTDMDESYTPINSGLGWTVSLEDAERQFNGRAKIESQKTSGNHQRLVGIVLDGKGILRNHLPLFQTGSDEQFGETTSGSFSPTTKKAIAMARINAIVDGLEVEIRGKRLPVHIVKMPFVKDGKTAF